MQRRLKYICFFFLISFVCYGETQDQLSLSLQECISLTLKSNISIQSQSISPKIQDASIMMAKGALDPSFTLSPSISKSDEPSLTMPGIEVRSGNIQNFSVGITDPIFTGTRYSVSLNSTRSESNSNPQTLNPNYRSGLAFTVTQPLLEGFGTTINRASIIIAENNKTSSILRFKLQLIKTLSEAQSAYWELVYAIANLNVQQLALKQAQELLNINQKRRELGKASLSDVLQAQAAVASREADVISAEDYVRSSEDLLKRITNIVQDESKWNKKIIPMDLPSYEEIEVELDESIKSALANRAEYLQAKLEIQNSDISIKVASNQKLPILDLEGSFKLNGLGEETGEPFSQIGKAEYLSWSTSLALKMPIGGKTGKGSLAKSRLEKEQRLLALKDLEQQIITEVRGTVRKLDTDKKRIEATIKAEEFAKQVLETETKKYELGLSTSYDLLQFQANLATATKNRLRAVIDYRKSVINFYQSIGTTLDKLGIEIKD
ncbi:MAG: TolC family protein [bacterium]